MRHSMFLLLLSALAFASVSSSGVRLETFCPSIAFDYLYNKYEILVPLRLTGDTRGVEVSLNPSFNSKESGLSASIEPSSSAKSKKLSLRCRTYERCQELSSVIASDPGRIRRLLRFHSTHSDSQSPRLVQLPGRSLVRSNCNRGWRVFQQRVDGSVSFAQNYATYERGFGHPSGNYWMGLRNLYEATAIGITHSRCRLRIEVVGNDGRRYRKEIAKFEVEGPRYKYRVSLANPVGGGNIPSKSILYHNQAFFTTYDRDQDQLRNARIARPNCASRHGYGGWWYKGCYRFNPNGVYTRKSENNYDFACFNSGRRLFQTLRRSKLMFKCV